MAEYICPHCKKPVYDDEALLCLYCGESLRRRVGFLPRAVVIAVAVTVILGFLLYLFGIFR